MSFWSDLLHDIQLGVESAAGGSANVTQAAGPATATAPGQLVSEAPYLATIAGIWTELRNGKMWRSLGWLLLGILLMFLGVAWWIGPSAARRSPAGIVAGQLG